MKKILFATTNEAKIKQVRGALSPAGINVFGVKDKSLLPQVNENGKTALENATIKATTFAKALGQTVFAMDNALYLEGLPPEDQPGTNVRRIKGYSDRLNDREMLEHYSKLVGRLGGRTKANWEFGVCISNPQGKYKEAILKSSRIIVSTPSKILNPGYPLESIQIEPKSGKYISEMSQYEQDLFWQEVIGKPLLKFVQKVNL